jgi:hypothetical protein
VTRALAGCTHTALAAAWLNAASVTVDAAVLDEAFDTLDREFDPERSVLDPLGDLRHGHPRDERRRERRRAIRLDVCASVPGTDTIVEGMTINISETGLSLQMPEPPAVADQDLLVGDTSTASVVAGHVIDSRAMPGGDVFYWHVRVTAADDQWLELVARVSGTPPNRPA